jgi:endonuclease G
MREGNVMPVTNERLERYLRWITQHEEGGLESLPSDGGLLDGLATPPGVSAERIETAARAARKVVRAEPLDDVERGELEAIIIPGKRPVIDIVDGTYAAPGGEFANFGHDDLRAVIEAAILSVGRIELPDHPTLPYGGTGFVVGHGLLMTNRHVAELFASGLGRDGLAFVTGRSAGIDFLQERDRGESAMFRISQVVMIHPYWDMALLAVAGLDDRAPLRLAADGPDSVQGGDVAVIGYPAFDPRNATDLQNEIFDHTFNVKRLQPGRLRERMRVRSFGHDVDAITHDSSTLGGNSGSVVLDVSTGLVAGLHFAGRYLEANYAVPSHELAGDARVVDAGVVFDAAASPRPTAWDGYWLSADPAPTENRFDRPDEPTVSTAAMPTAELGRIGDTTTWVVPIEITVRVGTASLRVATRPAAAAIAAETEKLVEPVHDENLVTRRGYDPHFLGIEVPPPEALDPSIVSTADDGAALLPYQHFSIAVHKQRRLPLFSCSNVDASKAAKQPEPGRDYTRRGLTGLGPNEHEKWYTDPRIPAVHQLPDRFYNKDRQAFDKGHIVRREDAAWGASYDEVRRGNGDTYYVTNCTPQVGDFNRKIWLQLENLVLGAATAERLCVFTGPVLADDDPAFHGVADDGPVVVKIPQQYWKLAVARNGDRLESFAFVIDQDLSNVDLGEPTDPTEFVVPAEWRARTISVAALEQMLGELRFDPAIHDADQFGTQHGEQVEESAGVERYPG